MSLWLNDDELFELTGKRQRAKQIEILASYKPPIRFRVRPDDSFPLVDRAQFDEAITAKKQKRPDFDALRRAG